MWHNTRRGHNIIRKRYATRRFRLNVVNICVIIACFFVVTFTIFGIYSLMKINVVETNAIENISKVKEETKRVRIYEEIPNDNVEDKTFKISFLGEMMMGGTIGNNLNYNYKTAFKNITEYTSKADYTVVNLVTNIIDLEKLQETKSKYIVTKSILDAFTALGVDGINIASDHMLDFGEDIFKDTLDILDKDYDLIGLSNKTVYIEHNGIKIALIGVCNEIIGTESKYLSAGIMMYNLKQIKSMIQDAKQNVNSVIILTHLGIENNNTVTNTMSWFYKELINFGADAVLGSHALGLYPVEIYKEKPIIYSMSNLMSDTNYRIGKESGVFTLNVNKDGNIESLEILPLYINAKKQTVLYGDYDKNANTNLLKYLTKNLQEEKYNLNDNYATINLK